jgi:hypothetical protein
MGDPEADDVDDETNPEDILAMHIESHWKELGFDEHKNIGPAVKLHFMAEEIEKLREELIWCSGSADFGPGGKAHVGWMKGPARLLTKPRVPWGDPAGQKEAECDDPGEKSDA